MSITSRELRGLLAADDEQFAILKEMHESAAAEIEDFEALFQAIRSASSRAIKQWQEKHPGNDHVWPDTAKLNVWLMNRILALEEDNERLEKQLDGCCWSKLDMKKGAHR